MLLEYGKVGITRNDVDSINRLSKREQVQVIPIANNRRCLIFDVNRMTKGSNDPHQIFYITILDITAYLVPPRYINYFLCQLRTDKHLKPHISHYAANRL